MAGIFCVKEVSSLFFLTIKIDNTESLKIEKKLFIIDCIKSFH